SFIVAENGGVIVDVRDPQNQRIVWSAPPIEPDLVEALIAAGIPCDDPKTPPGQRDGQLWPAMTQVVTTREYLPVVRDVLSKGRPVCARPCEAFKTEPFRRCAERSVRSPERTGDATEYRRAGAIDAARARHAVGRTRHRFPIRECRESSREPRRAAREIAASV